MNKNLKDRADRLMQSIYLDGYEHGYKDALKSIFNYEEQEHYEKLSEHTEKSETFTEFADRCREGWLDEIIDKYKAEGSDKE